MTLAFSLPGVAAPPEPPYADIWQTWRARKLLYDDPALGPFNLGVRVKDRVAVLWGPAPSLEVALRAEARLRTMFELIDVRNELIILPDETRDGMVTPPPGPRLTPEPPPPALPAPRPFLHLDSPRALTWAERGRGADGTPFRLAGLGN